MTTMTPEERFERIERQLEFLTNHQAQLYASLETLRDVAARHDTQISQLAETAARHDSQIVQLHDVASSLVRIIEDLGRRTDERLNDLAGKLNTLVNVVERYFSNGHTR